MKYQEKKESTILSKITCTRCEKTDYVSFVPSGDRPYYCTECLEEMHTHRKQNKVEEMPSKKGTVYRFLCVACDRIVKQLDKPLERDGVLYCRHCTDEMLRKERTANRGKVRMIRPKDD